MDEEWILITGISGRVGQVLAGRLRDRYRIIGLDIKRPSRDLSGVDFMSMDLTKEENISGVLRQVKERTGGQLAAVIHLAAYYSFSEKESPKYDSITVQGTERFFDALQDFEIEQFIFSSTMLVHKPCRNGEKITEHSPLEARWGYPLSKIRTERLLRAKHGEIPLVLLRIAGCYDHQCHSIPLAHQIQRIYEKRFTGHVYSGNTARGQSFLHFDDLAKAVRIILDRRSELGREETFLIGEPRALSYDELQKKISFLIHGDTWQTYTVPKSFAKTGAWVQQSMPFLESPFIKPWMIDLADNHYDLDISRARRKLDWEPQYCLGNVLPSMITFLLEDPVRFYRENDLPAPASFKRRVAA